MGTDSLGDRMKGYEHVNRAVLPRRTYTLIRADGRSFHNYLRNADKPFDLAFQGDMDAVATALCEEISGAVLAYTQSDEISILATDFGAAGTQPWFGGVVAKQVSISAALATAVLNERRPGHRALFDSRVFTIPDRIEAANYLIWRQRDCVRNSVTMAAQAQFPHQRLHGANTGRMQEMLWSEAGINWSDYPDGCKRGRVIVKTSGHREVTYTSKRTGAEQPVTALRTWWEARPAPHFTLNPDGFLAATIPAMPDWPVPGQARTAA